MLALHQLLSCNNWLPLINTKRPGKSFILSVHLLNPGTCGVPTGPCTRAGHAAAAAAAGLLVHLGDEGVAYLLQLVLLVLKFLHLSQLVALEPAQE